MQQGIETEEWEENLVESEMTMRGEERPKVRKNVSVCPCRWVLCQVWGDSLGGGSAPL